MPFFTEKVHSNGLIYPHFIHVLPVFEKAGFWREGHKKAGISTRKSPFVHRITGSPESSVESTGQVRPFPLFSGEKQPAAQRIP